MEPVSLPRSHQAERSSKLLPPICHEANPREAQDHHRPCGGFGNWGDRIDACEQHIVASIVGVMNAIKDNAKFWIAAVGVVVVGFQSGWDWSIVGPAAGAAVVLWGVPNAAHA